MPESQPIRPSIYLDYGADAVAAEDAACEICERGMRFKSPWRFSLGSVLRISFAFEDGAPRRIEADACVAECLAGEGREYQTTLAFVEAPQELRASLGKVSTRLKFSSRRGGAPVASPSGR
ncbi:MAG: hypothetical protein PHQ12_08725 [Chthoniobacteraceae bacterium]|nr:hypothetical protein [Chthoniobacteraceae bacterium]